MVEKTQTNGMRGRPREVKSPAMIRAEHNQLTLGTESASILKLIGGENLGSDNNEDTRTTALKIKRMKYIKSSETTIQKNIKRALLEHKMEQFENESAEVISSEFSERSNSSNHTTNPCKGLETFEKFDIMVNGLCVDSKLHENIYAKEVLRALLL
ncbi:hypothetical protein LguiB_016389 [Lonicera macranthoides]